MPICDISTVNLAIFCKGKCKGVALFYKDGVFDLQLSLKRSTPEYKIKKHQIIRFFYPRSHCKEGEKAYKYLLIGLSLGSISAANSSPVYVRSAGSFLEQRQVIVSSLSQTSGHIRWKSILARLRGLQDKLLYLVLFSLYPSLVWELRDKRNFKNLQV